ncbi:SLAP domain-containing protein [Tumebacillus lipolyticus]|uniref:SLAP domain-containing protein n=1 Tax=Tumebacillus lipolyticus TaxID=1280370 RepID=A0ABW4ZW78_9BACL
MDQKKESIFTRMFGGSKPVQDELEPEVDESSIPTTGTVLPHTVLRFTPAQEARYSEQEKIDLQSKLNTLPPLSIGEINFVPIDAGTIQGGYFVKVFIRHGRDLMEEFTMEGVPLSLIDATGDKVAHGVFRLQDFGTLQFGESRFWTFAWRPQQVLKQNADLSAYTVAFE